MQTALWFVAAAFAAFLALWPVVMLFAAVRMALARQWRSVGRVAWLLPVWTIAASIGVKQLAPLLQVLQTGATVQRPLWAWVALLVALFAGGLAWALLVAAVRAPPPAVTPS